MTIEYKVTSIVIELDQKIGAVTKTHNSDYTRTVEWQKTSEDDPFFTLNEAEALKKYLDEKKNFKDNNIYKITNEDDSSIIDLTLTAKKLLDEKISLDEPIEIEQCRDLSDYNLPFNITGYLNENDLQ